MFVTYEKIYNNYEIAKLNSKKLKNFTFTKKKSLEGLTPNPVSLHLPRSAFSLTSLEREISSGGNPIKEISS